MVVIYKGKKPTGGVISTKPATGAGISPLTEYQKRKAFAEAEKEREEARKVIGETKESGYLDVKGTRLYFYEGREVSKTEFMRAGATQIPYGSYDPSTGTYVSETGEAMSMRPEDVPEGTPTASFWITSIIG